MEEKITLPAAFEERMRKLLKDEYDEFLSSYDLNRSAGLRRNPLKLSADEFEKAVPFRLTPVEWAFEGYRYELAERPGKNPLHDAGAYYIQEPSAMSAVSVLDPVPGDFVLDLCAAPGGKSTQIAGRLMGEGLLVSNEYVRDRAKILSSNIERMGIRNAVVLNEPAERLSQHFPSFFDKILVDAPCSGEGMFKKEELAVSEWSPDHVTLCAKRQADILNAAAPMLKAGGVLVYSTCTFNPTENEQSVSDFLDTHPEFYIEESPCSKFFAQGHPEWAEPARPELSKAMRLWPHLINGEGHFVCRLRKQGTSSVRAAKKSVMSKADEKLISDISAFLLDELHVSDAFAKDMLSSSVPVVFGENIYLCPAAFGPLSGLTAERPGLHVAVSKKNRLEPSHSLALALKPGDFSLTYDLNDAEADKYLHGETLNCDISLKGWVLMVYKGCSVGFSKAAQGILKNHYPKGLRRM